MGAAPSLPERGGAPAAGGGSGGSGGSGERGAREVDDARVTTAKRQIEVYYRDLATRTAARDARVVRVREMGAGREEGRRLLREAAEREVAGMRRRRDGKGVCDFEFVRKIGQGSYGEVFLVRAKADGQLYALKKVEKASVLKGRCVSHVWLERFVFATCGNRSFVCRMEGSFQDRHYLYFLCEYLPGGDLLSMLIRDDTLPEAWARFYISEIVVALDSLHRTGIIHRDVKPDNVIFGQHGHIRLADFGLSKSLLHVPPPGVVVPAPQQPEPPPDGLACGRRNVAGSMAASVAGPVSGVLTPQYLDHVRMGAGARVDIPIRRRLAAWKAVARLSVFSTVGTPNYIAPEVVQLRSYHEAADWWSVGCILYEMLVGFPPFWAEDVGDTYAMIMHAHEHLVFPHRSDPAARHVSPEAEDLLRRLLVVEPAVRLGALRGLDEFKEHPFFAGVEWDSLEEQRAPFVPTLTNDTDTRYFDEEVTCQRVPPPSLVSGQQSSGGSSAGGVGSAPDAQPVAAAGPSGKGGGGGGGCVGVYGDDDLSFASSTTSRVSVHRGSGSGGSVSTSATESVLVSAAASTSTSMTSSALRQREPSSPFGSASSSWRRPKKRTRLIKYEERCVHPEFVGFTYINDAQPFRRPLTSDIFRPPSIKVEADADAVMVEAAVAEAEAERRGQVAKYVSPGGLPGVQPAQQRSPVVAVGTEGTVGAEGVRSSLIVAASLALPVQSPTMAAGMSPAAGMFRPSLRAPLVDGGSEAEDDRLFDDEDDESVSSATSTESASFESDESEVVESRTFDVNNSIPALLPVAPPARDVNTVMLEGVQETQTGQAAVRTAADYSPGATRKATTARLSARKLDSDTAGADSGVPMAAVDATPPSDDAVSRGLDLDREISEDDGRPLQLVEEESEDPLASTGYENADLVRLFSNALNMPVEMEDEVQGIVVPASEPGTPPSHARNMSGFQTLPLPRSISRAARHSRQASVHLPVSPVMGGARGLTAAMESLAMSSSRLEVPEHSMSSRASSSRFGSIRPTHAKRTDAGQQSMRITSPPVGPGDGPEDMDFVDSGLYSGQQASSGPLHALEVAAALGEAATAVSSLAGSLQGSLQGSPQPPARCVEGSATPLNARLPSFQPLPLQTLPAAAMAPGLSSHVSSRRSSPAPRPLSGGRPLPGSMPLSPLAVSVTPSMPTPADVTALGIHAQAVGKAPTPADDNPRSRRSGPSPNRTPPRRQQQ